MRVQGAAGVVLAGGRSSRMGLPKAELEWHGSTLLYRAAALLTRAVDGPVVVVRAPGQALPPLPAGVRIAEDPVAGLGPMQGIAAGLAEVAGVAELAFVCSCDLPFLHPAYVRRVLAELRAGVELVVPVAAGYRQPLAAGYRTTLSGLLSRLIGDGELRLGMLHTHCRSALPDEAALRADPELARLDPELASVVNVNTPEEYAAARRRPPPRVPVDCNGLREVPAATLGAAASAVGVELNPQVRVWLNGERSIPDGHLPLVTGDRVRLRHPVTDDDVHT